jgi:hypothetical protein
MVVVASLLAGVTRLAGYEARKVVFREIVDNTAEALVLKKLLRCAAGLDYAFPFFVWKV